MTPPKLTVDSAGRVHGTNVTWNDPWPCRNGDSGGMVVPSGIMGAVLHTMAGNLPGTVDWFNQSAAEASAHFGIDQDGNIHQFGPVNGWMAWAQSEGNPHWYSIEMADNQKPETPLTQAQIDSAAQLLELLSRPEAGRFSLQITNKTGTEGLGWHGMGGAAWGGHFGCPGDVRAGQRPAIVSVAQAIRGAHGSALPANWVFDKVQKLAVASIGTSSVKLTWSAPGGPAGAAAVKFYEIAASEGKTLAAEAPSYPRQVAKGTNPEVWQGGSLTPGKTYTFGVRALAASDDPHHAGAWATITAALR